MNFPMTVFWKVCFRYENESVINSKQYWQCTNRKSITIDRRLGYQKPKTMVKRHVDQKIRTRKFDASDERVETGVLVKS